MPGGSGGGIPGNGGCTGLAFGRFFPGRGLATHRATIRLDQSLRSVSLPSWAWALPSLAAVKRHSGILRSGHTTSRYKGIKARESKYQLRRSAV